MKILLATSRTSQSGTGVPSYNFELQKCLSPRNTLYLLTDSDEHEVSGYEATFSTFGSKISDFDYVAKLIDQINAAKYDCIINSASAFMPIIAPFVNAPIVSVSHFVKGTLADNAGYNAKYLNGIVALSEYGKIHLVHRFSIKCKDKIRVIYNCVQEAPIQYPEKKTQRPIKIIYPGGTSVQKSVDIIQQTVYKLIKSDMDFEFIWIGSTTLPSTKMSLLGLHSTIDLFPKDSRLKILGYVPREQAADLMGSTNVFLLPSRREGCPMTLLEAMREGCIPIVSDAHHGSRELLEKAHTGFVLKQGSSKAIYDCIRQIILNPEKYEQMYEASRKYLLSELSTKIWIDAMESMIDYAVSLPKAICSLTKTSYAKSYCGLSILYGLDRLETMIRSAICRFNLDWNYLKMKMGLF